MVLRDGGGVGGLRRFGRLLEGGGRFFGFGDGFEKEGFV